MRQDKGELGVRVKETLDLDAAWQWHPGSGSGIPPQCTTTTPPRRALQPSLVAQYQVSSSIKSNLTRILDRGAPAVR
jgi:hypothetical protein